MVLIGPSNPYLSVGPILAVPGIRAAILERRVPCVAVNPLVGGRAVKGPADRMLARLAGGTTAAHVASVYAGLIDAIVVDEGDDVSELDVQPIVTRTLMRDEESRRRVAEAALSVPV
jgi:LPPG:FO 2-phospho-L-lactate transferase